MINRRIVGFVEGFVITTGIDRYGRSFTLEQILVLRDEIDNRPWLFLGIEPNEPPVGRVVRCEIRDVGGVQGLWARVEFYQANALKITSEGILNFFGYEIPANPMERRRPADFEAYEALRQQQEMEAQRQLAGYHTPPYLPAHQPPAPPPPLDMPAWDQDAAEPPIPAAPSAPAWEPRPIPRWDEAPPFPEPAVARWDDQPARPAGAGVRDEDADPTPLFQPSNQPGRRDRSRRPMAADSPEPVRQLGLDL